MVKVEVVYAGEQEVIHLHCELAEGSTVADALDCSGLYTSHPETQDLAVGIFGKKVSPQTVLRQGDRIEMYRALVGDPMEKRRRRAKGASRSSPASRW